MDGRLRIAILDADTVTKGDVSLDPITSLGEATVRGYTPNGQAAEAIGEADAVICNRVVISEEVFSRCPNLKYVGLFATGYNNVDLEAAKRHGAAVCNVPCYSEYAVAQHTFALILEHYNRVSQYAQSVYNGDWINYGLFSYFGISTSELCGRTMGIVGYGSIGRRTAAIARAFGMNVMTHTRSPEKITDGTPAVSLEELLKTADIVSLHCPLTAENARMINAETIALMKPTALLINTARGGLVDEQALADALNGGRIAGAGIDCLTAEPMRADCPLYRAKNLIMTPHVAWAPTETRERLMAEVAENLRSWVAGASRNNVAI